MARPVAPVPVAPVPVAPVPVAPVPVAPVPVAPRLSKVETAARVVRLLSPTVEPLEAQVASRAQPLARRPNASPIFPVPSGECLQHAYPVTLAPLRSVMMSAVRRFAEHLVAQAEVAGWRQSHAPPTKCAHTRPPVLQATDAPPLAWPFPTPVVGPKATSARPDSIASFSGLLVESAPPTVFPQGSATTPTAGGMACASRFPATQNVVFISITQSAAATESPTQMTARG
jgi:hypothetical protein